MPEQVIVVDVSGGNRSVTGEVTTQAQNISVSAPTSSGLGFLGGGNTGQFLSKNSDNNLDVVWVDKPHDDIPSLTLLFENGLV
jgi:hypothetical protein